MLHYQINIIPKWKIKNHPNYFIDDKNNVRNLKTGKVLKMQLNQYTKGYCLNGKFKSLKQIKLLLEKYEENKCPF